MPQLALVQMEMDTSLDKNLAKATAAIESAANSGAQIILLPELFAHKYFCQKEKESFFLLAHGAANHPYLQVFQELAKKHQVVLPISFFEKANQSYFNSVVTFDADGTNLGLYRKTHIPDGPGYEEKFYFTPGNLAPRVWKTRYGTLGIGICWDQWYPELARCLVLLGADLILYPSAIGSEPNQVASPSDKAMWRRVMVGHSVANSCYVAAANRVGKETLEDSTCTFYGSSFISDYCGEVVMAAESQPTIITKKLDFKAAAEFRAGMGFFRDRRPEFYKNLLTLDGYSR